ncbi:hypothetical protein LCGC14_0219910 [marine sediment metagenome]|uniref:Uncharacterized protein n=1 Tax=marine sediment metagenome TaxID=412755 RepID=A0A0F9WXI0_9ZZZZ
MNRSGFRFRHRRQGETGYVAILWRGNWALAAWCGYGKPVWWKPRFMGKGNARYGFGFGWLLLCFRVHIIELKKEKV